jgi:hypothetical protein
VALVRATGGAGRTKTVYRWGFSTNQDFNGDMTMPVAVEGAWRAARCP